MNTNIFIPKKINVGFQNRKDTYTGKLAYIIYYDEKGKLRKETSWQNWRDKDIPNEEFDNEPIEGFVLNKKVGGYKTHWDARKTYTRVYDPRGFEFEITIPNLLWILENCNCIKGKGLEGQFIYGWDGTELVLVPINSADYQEITVKNKIIHNNEFIKAKDLIIGATYENLQGDYLVYMGRFPEYSYEANSYNSRRMEYEKPVDDSWHTGLEYYTYEKHPRLYRSILVRDKTYWFIMLGKPDAEYDFEKRHTIVTYTSLTKRLYRVVNEKCHDDYIALVDILNKSSCYSPIDYLSNKIIDMPFEDFQKLAYSRIHETTEYNYRYHMHRVGIRVQNKPKQLRYANIGYNPKTKQFFSEIDKRDEYNYSVFVDLQKETYDSVEELYNALKPVYGEQYLENGYLHERWYYYGAKE